MDNKHSVIRSFVLPLRAHRAPCPAAEPISARQPALRPHVHKQPEKTTRVRTVLNEKQLHTLRTCYAANPRPDALMKEQLVEMTGLSPRVIRVWFQNKRCKDKKRSIMMKQLQQQQPNDKTVSGPGPGRGLEEACVLSAHMGWLSPSGSRAGAGPGGPSLPPAPRGEATGPAHPPGPQMLQEAPLAGWRPTRPQPTWVGSPALQFRPLAPSQIRRVFLDFTDQKIPSTLKTANKS